ncbi:endonuclease [Ulvibacter antarcticus]|uniref:Putative secreted protein (Por secretion system target) n=1 Tax=Ulvibacter antarcticus TaxID=442714 RepID=A0A3L9YVX4_9FLAO|nr:endonuclease [Ulvibacter antarcticus]RMA64663.1 putative secreted protein (Por secretion system target) [Ulvibacter antarcticus]
MNNRLLLLFMLPALCFGQQPYYNGIDLSLTGQDMYLELQSIISNYNSNFNYGDVRDTVLITDEDTENSSNVLLIYGYDDTGSCTTDRTRDKDDFGGTSCEYNREHVFSRSNANPTMGSVNNASTGIGADPHNLRPSDQQMNGNRDNKKFATGSGDAGNVGSGNWYPGDEWKGDVARMMMYMYTRYGDRCLPSLNGAGTTQSGNDMLQIYLQWNADDMVNDYEDQRNPYLENVYGNRNPFIDNPYLATIIWGGPVAEDRWGLASVSENDLSNVVIFPIPSSETIWVQSNSSFPLEAYVIYDLSGRIISEATLDASEAIDISSLNKGLYLLEVGNTDKKITKKIIVN